MNNLACEGTDYFEIPEKYTPKIAKNINLAGFYAQKDLLCRHQ